MVTVCAWCQKYLATKDPVGMVHVSHGICSTCAMRQRIGDLPTLVIAKKWERARPLMEALLRGTPAIRVVVDRRVAARRKGRRTSPTRERRSSADRRQGDNMLLV
jgi:hypothetical protein